MSSRRPAPTASCSSTADRRGASDALMKAVAGLPGGGPVHTIFNTHWHPEQTGSNEPLGKAGATIIAHENTRLWLTTDVTWPWNGQRFKTLAEDRAAEQDLLRRPAQLDSGVRYGYIPDAAHTDGDMYVYFPTAERARGGRRRLGPGLAGRSTGATGGWIGGIVGGLAAAADAGQRRTRGSCRGAGRCSAWRISRRSTRCTARSTIV